MPTNSVLFIFLFACVSLTLSAQQSSSKSKSKDKLYDKEGQRNIDIKNAVLINSPNLEFSPVYYQNGLVYVSSRHNAGAIDKKIGETFFELFYSELDANGNPTKPQEFSINVNSQVHEGPVSFSQSGERMYFTRNNMNKGIRKSDSKGVTRLKIYEAKRGVFDWENVKEMSFNSDEYSVMHPTLSSDEKQLYFSSDMPGGYGGFDLYVVEKTGGSWSTPVNLGKEINTDKNEVFPFIHNSGTFFFSSNGHNGNGGLDLFLVDLSGPTQGVVFNMGTPFSSESDDLGLILNEEGTQGYFASGRTGGIGKDDIYSFKALDGLQGLGEVVVQNSKIIVLDSNTGERVVGAGIRIIEQAKDGFLEGNEFYDVELAPVAENSSELVMKLRRKDASTLDEPALFTNDNGELIEKLKEGKKYLILVTKDGYKNGELLYAVKNEGEVIEIPLSEGKYVNVGGRITAASNASGLSNTTIKITNNADGTVETINTDFKGSFNINLPIGGDFTAIIEKEGFEAITQTFSTKNANGDLNISQALSSLTKDIPVAAAPIKEGSVIVLENIYYDFNKSAIRTGEDRELDALVDLMKRYQTMEVDLVAHTDSRGTAEYNMNLSMQRAQSAKQYLVNKGISKKRINAFGYGETQLRNRCVDGVKCEEREHQYNRRTEVRVTKLKEDVKVEYKD